MISKLKTSSGIFRSRAWIILSQWTGLNSIQGRLTAIALLFIVGTAIAMGIVGFHFTLNFEKERFQEHFNLLASYLASNAELGVLLQDEKMLQERVENMLAVKDVQLIKVLGRDGKIIIQREAMQALSALGYTETPVFSTVMETAEGSFVENGSETEILGRVVIGYSLTGLAGLKKQLAYGFVLISLLLAVVPVFLYWKLSRTIREPLQEVLQVAGKVSAGQLNIRAKADSLLETATLAKAFNDMLDAIQYQRQQIKDANEAVAKQKVLAEVGKFSMTVAHEIKNPLAIIKGSLSVLRKADSTTAEIKTQMINYIEEEVMRINKLVEDFLLFARPGSPVFQTWKLEDLVMKLTGRLRLLNDQIQVTTNLPEEIRTSRLDCDVALFERALFNVVRNALEAGAEKQPVQVSITGDSRRLVFDVADGGPGLTRKNEREIFEPFFSTKAKGTGLGLAIAKEVIHAHGGGISAANGKDGGAVFTLTLLHSAADEHLEKENSEARGNLFSNETIGMVGEGK